MMFVLMAILLIGAVTLSVMQIITADVAGGVQELAAEQVFNVAQAGVHYGIGQLLLSGAGTYAGQTITITSGSTTLGTAAITVNCIDTTPTNGWAPPCSSSIYPGYRRIISTGSLPVAGPARTIVAIVQATSGGGTYALCGLQSVTVDSPGDPTTFYGDIGSNGTISISTTLNPPGTYVIAADPGSPPKYAGVARAVGTITCAGGCATQVQGGVFPGQSGSVCSTPPPPTFVDASSFADQTIPAQGTWEMNSSTGFNWRNIVATSTTAPGNSGNCPWTDLKIHASDTDPTAVTVVNINTLTMGTCTRLTVLGVGKVNLMVGAPTGISLYVGGQNKNPVHFGVDANDKFNSPSPLPNGQLTVWINSSNMTCSGGNGSPPTPSCAGMISHASGSATVFAPNGSFNYDDSLGALGQTFNGPVVANQISLTGWNTMTVGAGTSFMYSTFNKLLSWKDQ